MVIWIIGLSGSGKSTLASEIVSRLRRENHKICLLDGDEIRELFDNDLDHSIEGRRKNADRICKLCKYIETQGFDVVCAILSLFPESRKWNRENLLDYYEVYIDAPLDELIRRDVKGIYSRFLSNEITDVAGMDLDFIPPDSPDLKINNSGSLAALLAHADKIVETIKKSTWT